jgi:hypothetical protein
MTKSRSRFAGLLLLTLLFAAAALAQDSTGTAATPAETAEPAAKAPGASPAAEAPAAKPATTRSLAGAKTIVGEVVDPACYLVNGAHGEGHKECAIACAKAGQTLAILEKKTNKVYLSITDHPGEDPNKLLIDYVAQTVTVKGKLYTRGGVTGILVLAVEPGGGK